MMVIPGEKDVSTPDPGQVKEDFFHYVLAGLVWILFLKNHAHYNVPSVLDRIWQQTHTPFLPTASLWDPLGLLPSSPWSETGFSLQIPSVFWIALESGENLFTLAFVILKSGCLKNYIELEKK